MRSGKLRHRIIIQEKSTTEVRDSYGADITGWETYKTVWAEIDPPLGREYFSSKQKQAEITTRIRIRYLSGLDPAMRIKFGDRYFDINSIIDHDERNRELVMMCSEKVT